MISIKELIDKIRFDKNLKKDDYEFFYADRILKKKMSFRFDDIKEFGNFLTLETGNKNIELPLHRIREVRKNNKLIWERRNEA
ncbi:DUF504 domain-containing protein [Candidatus Woesearchaeota archaeon]|nr:DUF504 domain-containing protein [Candidatus Woesearchaeota archaeon]